MKTRLIALLLTTIFGAFGFAADPPLQDGIEVRGFLGVVVPSALTQVPTGDFRTILSIFPNSPAEAAGIVPGDYILAVDGKPTAAMKNNLELVHALQGAPGSVVRLELKRIAGGQVETVAITRIKKLFSPDFPK